MATTDFNYQSGSPNGSIFSPDEIEKMRNTVLRADKERNGGRDIDLNKPVSPAYSFKKFPMIVYKHDTSVGPHDVEKESPQKVKYMAHVPAKYDQRVVKNEMELEKALSAGYEEKPPDFNTVEAAAEIDSAPASTGAPIRRSQKATASPAA